MSDNKNAVIPYEPLNLPHLTLAKRRPLQAIIILLGITLGPVLTLLEVLAEYLYVVIAFVPYVITLWYRGIGDTRPEPQHWNWNQQWNAWMHPVGQTRLTWLLSPGAQQPGIVIATDLICVVLLAFVGFIGYLMIKRRREQRRRRQVSNAHGSAKIAQIPVIRRYAVEPINELADSLRLTVDTVRELRGRPPRLPTNYIVGREEGTLVLIGLRRLQLENHVAIVATSGSGKSATQAAGALLRETGRHPFVATSLKGDLFTWTAGAVSRQQRVWNFSLMDVAHSHGYDPLDAITTFELAQQFAMTWITNTGRSGSDGAFWDRNAELLVLMLVWHLRVTEPDSCFPRLIDLVHLLYEDQRDLLTNSPDLTVRMMAVKAFESWDADTRLRGNISSDGAARFKDYIGPNMRRVLSRRDIRFAEMLDPDNPTGLYLSMTSEQMKTYHALYATMMKQLLETWTTLATAMPGQRLPNGALLYLDEFANMGAIPDFSGYLAQTRSMGIGMILMVQNRSQLDKIYGEADALTIFGGCKTHIVFSGCTAEDAQYYSKVMDDMTVQRHQSGESERDNASWGRSRGVAETGRRLLRPNEIQHLPRDMVIMIPNQTDPMLIRTRPYDRDPYLKKLAAMPPPVIDGPPVPAPFIPPSKTPKPKPPRRPSTPKKPGQPPTQPPSTLP